MTIKFAPLASATKLVSAAGSTIVEKVRRNKIEESAETMAENYRINTIANQRALEIVKQRLNDNLYPSMAYMMADQENEIKRQTKLALMEI